MLTLVRSERVRNWTLQVFVLVVVVAVTASFVVTARHNLLEQGIASGFDFLDRTTGWDIPFSLIDYSISSSYSRVLFAGFLNTIFAGLFSLLMATLFGTLIGMARVSTNFMLNLLGTVYVEIFRNVPLILQAFFWYAVVTHLPAPKRAHELAEMVYLSSRGLYIPWFNVPDGTVLFLAALGLLSLLGAIFLRGLPAVAVSSRNRSLVSWGALALVLVVGGAAVIGTRAPDAPFLSIPVLKGFAFRGGLRIMPEFSALTISIICFGSAYIAEIVRGGFLSVNRGQVEAARSLGLKPWPIYWTIRIPLALRAIVPPMGNQYVWLMKATTVGIAIGFSDLFMVVSTSINQSGQTIELLFIMMSGFFIINYAIASTMNAVNRAIAIKGYESDHK